MHASQQTLEMLYGAFARLDSVTMARSYSPDASFDDEVFSLRGHREVTGMWHMLCDATKAKGRDVWRLEYSGVAAEAATGQAHWEADYRFSATGRMVHNVIDSHFTFDSAGLIKTQRDNFDFWAWSRQALGAPGLLLGWSPFLKSKVRATAATNLKKYLASRP
ncbi:MAG: nuclear transport factor 2 family protein [Pseudomonadota bacterium]|uniref:nuclear transport factor 2 family protein n=1 Tax=Polaromonas sp. TaxID=1869339 RepID=UPI0017921991|nr:nuclear transport factor 2 family protein [Polaromonas sp.]MBA3594868.1 nuclear transport factor 2 family protein [Polaromonas sp.]MDQ3271956.1 nuclear transport factor 2 family protein [Pseudomonadota bacterium]